MKNTFFFIIGAMVCSMGLQAQNWKVGESVNRTIIDFPDSIFVSYFCDTLNDPNGQEAEFLLPIPAVDGIEYYVHIDYATSPSYTYKLRQGNNVQILSLGDSMQIFSTAPRDTVHLSYAGYESFVSLKFKAFGTPTTAGQMHPCGSTNDGWFFQPIQCLMPYFADNNTYSTACEVEYPSALTSPDQPQSMFVFPNPASDWINISQEDTRRIIILNLQGQKVFEHQFTKISEKKADISSLSSGVYFLEGFDENSRQIFTQRISVITN